MKESQLIAAVKSAGYEAKAFKGEDESFEKSNKLGFRLLLTFFLTYSCNSAIDDQMQLKNI
jgi:P-type Cu+ transporter